MQGIRVLMAARLLGLMTAKGNSQDAWSNFGTCCPSFQYDEQGGRERPAITEGHIHTHTHTLSMCGTWDVCVSNKRSLVGNAGSFSEES